MYFNDIHATTQDQQVRAWCVEQAIQITANRHPMDVPYQDTIVISKMVEDYVTNGDVTGVVQAAVQEGYGEGRMEVKEEVEKWFDNVNLDDLFKAKGWIDEKGKVDG